MVMRDPCEGGGSGLEERRGPGPDGGSPGPEGGSRLVGGPSLKALCVGIT